MEVYVVGQGKPPKWIRGTFEPYEKADGSVGYQLSVGRLTWSLEKGDKVYRKPGGIVVDRDSEGYWRRW